MRWRERMPSISAERCCLRVFDCAMQFLHASVDEKSFHIFLSTKISRIRTENYSNIARGVYSFLDRQNDFDVLKALVALDGRSFPGQYQPFEMVQLAGALFLPTSLGLISSHESRPVLVLRHTLVSINRCTFQYHVSLGPGYSPCHGM